MKRRLEPMHDGLHQFLKRHHFYPLALCTILSSVLYLVEVFSEHGWQGPRLHLNLFLAWIPYLVSLGIAQQAMRSTKSPRVIWIGTGLWLLFFPNAPYLITDFAYLDWVHFDLWQRIGIFTSCALTGVMLGLISLLLVHEVIQKYYSKSVGWIVVSLACGLSGVGVWFGRFLRWNSWDLFLRPRELLSDLSIHWNKEGFELRPILFSLTFSAILFSVYLLLRSIQKNSIGQS